MKQNIAALALTGTLLLSACAQPNATPATQITQPNQASGEIFAMDTYMTITCYGERSEEALAACETEIARLDALLSVGNPESIVSKLNTEGSAALDPDTDAMVRRALELYDETNGAYDITIYPLMELWGFTSGDFAVPTADALTKTRSKVGADQLTYNDHTLTLAEGQGIDLGGIAKGYTSTRLMELFAEYELDCGVVSLGGNVQCYGTKPDGSLWRCGIQNPLDPDSTTNFMGILSVADTAVITSGTYQRFFIDETTGKKYHHIIDPATGAPAENGLLSVSIITPDGTLADALSTACFVLGREGAEALWRSEVEDFDMILMDENQTVYLTEPLAERFSTEFDTVILTK